MVKVSRAQAGRSPARAGAHRAWQALRPSRDGPGPASATRGAHEAECRVDLVHIVLPAVAEVIRVASTVALSLDPSAKRRPPVSRWRSSGSGRPYSSA